jgi:hypothetical protein
MVPRSNGVMTVLDFMEFTDALAAEAGHAPA